ncbi:MAG TPA: asparaginase [Bacillota bacterium]|nr:asparaginase [Bacillota bacterium]
MSSAKLVEDYRGGILENVHRGFIVVVNDQGKVIGSVGDPDQVVFYRSASKPIQALPVLAYGIDRLFGLTPEETTVMAGSHLGEPFHVDAIESILRKIGCKEEDLCMKPTYPAYLPRRNELICAGMPKRKIYHNCSGKHSAALAISRYLGVPIEGYWKPEHPAQQEILRCISYFTEIEKDKIGIGVDGCGVPVFAVPIRNMALGAMKMACPDRINDLIWAEAADRMGHNMNRYYRMVTGSNYICSLNNMDDNLVAKGGAEGVYGIGMRKQRLGIAFKCEDGTEICWPLIINEIFRQLGYENEAGRQRMLSLVKPYVINDNDEIVGEKKMKFNLFSSVQ